MLLLCSQVAVNIFNWVILPSLGNRAFELLGPLLLMAVFVVAVVNGALNLGIVARQSCEQAGHVLPRSASRRMALRSAVAIIVVITTLLVGMFLLNRYHVSNKMNHVVNEMVELARHEKTLLARLGRAIKSRATVPAIKAMLQALAEGNAEFRGLKLLLPIETHGRVLFSEVSTWTDDDAQIYAHGHLTHIFAPSRFERRYLEKALSSHGNAQPGVFVQRPVVKVFYPVHDDDRETLFFLYSDQHQIGRNDYK